MSLPVVFHRAASEEFIKASTWYESKQPGLSRDFIAEIERCITLAAQHPNQYMACYKDVRRVVAHRFPYSVYFRAEKKRIVVLAVFHSRRDPSTWRRRS